MPFHVGDSRVLAALGSVVLAIAVWDLITGKAAIMRYWSVDRSSQPALYWSSLSAHLMVAGVLLAVAVGFRPPLGH